MAETEMSKGRHSGPGGQHRNKVETGVLLEHTPTGIGGHAYERRSVRENLPVALRRLRLNLAVEHRVPVPIGAIGSKLWHSRLKSPKRGPGAEPAAWGRFDARIVVNTEHWDYPALLAEALDVLAAMSWEPKDASLRLEVSMSQLIKLIREHPPALVMVNEQRHAHGKHSLK